MDSNNKKLAASICDFLKQHQSLSTAVEQISSAFKLESDDMRKPVKLVDLFNAHLDTLSNMDQLKLSDDDVKKADSLKSQGNKKMSAKEFGAAIDFYTQAIAIDSKNPVYFANRAAAYSQDDKHDLAVQDSKSALLIDENYSKAYSRMGHAYFCLGEYGNAVQAYENGLMIDPDNAIMKQSLTTAQAKENETDNVEALTRSVESPPQAATSGGGFDFASMMSNPNFMNMASQMMNNPAISQMMQNPQMAAMAQNMMSDPSAMANMMNNPDLQRMMNGQQGGNQ